MTASKERKIKEQAQRIAELSAALEIERDHCNQGVAEAQVMARHIAGLNGRIAELEAAAKAAWAHIDECCECESETSETRAAALNLGCKA